MVLYQNRLTYQSDDGGLWYVSTLHCFEAGEGILIKAGYFYLHWITLNYLPIFCTQSDNLFNTVSRDDHFFYPTLSLFPTYTHSMIWFCIFGHDSWAVDCNAEQCNTLQFDSCSEKWNVVECSSRLLWFESRKEAQFSEVWEMNGAASMKTLNSSRHHGVLLTLSI